MTTTPPPPPPPLPPALGCSADSPLLVPDSPPWVGKPSHPGSCKRIYPEVRWTTLFSSATPGSPVRSGLPPPYPSPKRRRLQLSRLRLAERRPSGLYGRAVLTYTSLSPMMPQERAGEDADDERVTPEDQVSLLPPPPPPPSELPLAPGATPLAHLPPRVVSVPVELDDEEAPVNESVANQLLIEAYGLCGCEGVCELPMASHTTPIELLYFCVQCNKGVCGTHLQWDGKRVECMFCRHLNHNWLEQDHVRVRKARIHAFKSAMEKAREAPPRRRSTPLPLPPPLCPPSPDLGLEDSDEDINLTLCPY